MKPVVFLRESLVNSLYYPFSFGVARVNVPIDKKPWSVPWDDYKPNHFSTEINETSEEDHPRDTPDRSLNDFKPKFNAMDGCIDRRSFQGEYEVVNGTPRNPSGRMGIEGRGMLFRWGPNHEAVLIITRYKTRSKKLNLTIETNRSVQILVHKWRGDKKWSFATERIRCNETALEALNRAYYKYIIHTTLMEIKGVDMEKAEKENEELFQNGEEIYRGPLMDVRNTDNAWVESTVMHFSDAKRAITWPLTPPPIRGMVVRWVNANSQTPIFPSHTKLVQDVVQRLNVTW